MHLFYFILFYLLFDFSKSSLSSAFVSVENYSILSKTWIFPLPLHLQHFLTFPELDELNNSSATLFRLDLFSFFSCLFFVLLFIIFLQVQIQMYKCPDQKMFNVLFLHYNWQLNWIIFNWHFYFYILVQILRLKMVNVL